MEGLIKYAEESGTAEGRMVAGFVREAIAHGVARPEIEASLATLEEWCQVFRKELNK